jgi:hypothetical protein
LINIRALVFILILKELEDESHDLFEHLFLFLRLDQLAQKMVVDSPLLLVLGAQIFKLLLKLGKSVHHDFQIHGQLRCLIAHVLHSILGGYRDARALGVVAL